MRAILLLSFLAAVPAFAKSRAPATKIPAPTDIKVSTEFEYNDLNRKSETTTSAIFDRADHDWKNVSESNGITLQARVISSSEKDVRMEYQVLDSKKNDEVLASPAIIALFGEKAQMETQKTGSKLKISLMANPIK
jgi:hypothetical protein